VSRGFKAATYLVNARAGRVVQEESSYRARQELAVWPRTFYSLPCYYLSSRGGPLTRFPLRWKFTSTWSAMEMNGMPLFIP
jgi:hypothetical protein